MSPLFVLGIASAVLYLFSRKQVATAKPPIVEVAPNIAQQPAIKIIQEAPATQYQPPITGVPANGSQVSIKTASNAGYTDGYAAAMTGLSTAPQNSNSTAEGFAYNSASKSGFADGKASINASYNAGYSAGYAAGKTGLAMPVKSPQTTAQDRAYNSGAGAGYAKAFLP
jgi:hypothetical protein